jgi:hypothetical protein
MRKWRFTRKRHAVTLRMIINTRIPIVDLEEYRGYWRPIKKPPNLVQYSYNIGRLTQPQDFHDDLNQIIELFGSKES